MGHALVMFHLASLFATSFDTSTRVSPDLLHDIWPIKHISDLFHRKAFGLLEAKPGIYKEENLQGHKKKIVSPS